MLRTNMKEEVLPLLGSAFELGKAGELIESIEDIEIAEIAQAELYFFSANAKECVKIVKSYLSCNRIKLRLTAEMLYTFANMSLGNVEEAQKARAEVKECLKEILQKNSSQKEIASCLFAYYVICIFIHINPEEEFPALDEYIQYLPKGQRLFAISLMAHALYLEKEYVKAQGVLNGAFMIMDKIYPIPVIYMKCVMVVCQINQKDSEGAKETLMSAWEMARKDKLLEPFIEYHGLMQGMLEACVRKTEPEIYKKLVDGVLSFSRGWMKIHNPQMQKEVTDKLSPLEFSIAMLACRDWTNQEIGEYLGMSVNTVKHYVSVILEKLNIDKRDKIKEYVNQ